MRITHEQSELNQHIKLLKIDYPDGQRSNITHVKLRHSSEVTENESRGEIKRRWMDKQAAYERGESPSRLARSHESLRHSLREDEDDLGIKKSKGKHTALAEESLQTVEKLAEVKEIFDRFAVNGLMTGEEVVQALTELGTFAPRSFITRYLKARRLLGVQREVRLHPSQPPFLMLYSIY